MVRVFLIAMLALLTMAGCSSGAGEVTADESMEKQLLEAQKNAANDPQAALPGKTTRGAK